MTWEVRAVTNTGTLVATLDDVSVVRISRSINAQESAELRVPTLSGDTTYLDLFSNEVQIWLDGSVFFWGRPARFAPRREQTTDEMTVLCEGLFSYFYDVVVGGPRLNHITSPHQDSAAIDDPPDDWTVTSNVEAAAVVDNNAEFWQLPRAIQLNNSEAGQDAYMAQQYTVTAETAGPFAASARVYVADDAGGAPAYGGAAYNERGLMVMRLDSGGSPLSQPAVALITDDTPRNEVVRLQTEEVFAAAGEKIEVRCYAPDAYTVWRHVHLWDGRALVAEAIDKADAVELLALHAQDTAVGGKLDHKILVDAVAVGETVERSWPWWRRDRIGEQIDALLDTVEIAMDITATTRTLRVRGSVGSSVAAIGEADLVGGWSFAADLENTWTTAFRQGDGFGVARDEHYDGVGGVNNREALTFAAPGESLGQLRDGTDEFLDRVGQKVKVAYLRVGGSLATTIRPGDTSTVTLSHGWANVSGVQRCTAVDLDAATMTASLTLEPT